MWKLLPAIAFVWLTLLPATAVEPTTASFKDGFPTGTDTPEGAACDLARAFIHDDSALFVATCVEPYGTPDARLARHQFLQSIVVQMKLDPAGTPPSPESPKGIAKCFAARHLSQVAPTRAGAAESGIEDVMFVDVSALLQDGTTQLCRTLVLKTKQGKWLVDPQPETSTLSVGLDDETPSTQEFSGTSAPVK